MAAPCVCKSSKKLCKQRFCCMCGIKCMILPALCNIVYVDMVLGTKYHAACYYHLLKAHSAKHDSVCFSYLLPTHNWTPLNRSQLRRLASKVNVTYHEHGTHDPCETKRNYRGVICLGEKKKRFYCSFVLHSTDVNTGSLLRNCLVLFLFLLLIHIQVTGVTV